MNETNTIIVYKPGKMDLQPLRNVCKENNCYLHISTKEEEFREALNRGAVLSIIVPLTSDEEGGNNAREFATMASKILQPEDADVSIIYSLEGTTPDNWPGKLDPRPIQSNDIDTYICADDQGWKHTIDRLTWLIKQFRYQRSKTSEVVQIEFTSKSDGSNPDGPFPSEAEFLLRAAFKDMSRISIEHLKPGFSGSIVLAIQPFDALGNKKMRYMVKVYHHAEKKAFVEYKNYQTHVSGSLPSDYHPKYDPYRNYRGKAFSVYVIELIEGPKGKPISLKDLILSSEYTTEEVARFVAKAISVLNDYWSSVTGAGPVDLVWVYLRNCFGEGREKKEVTLLSYDSCHQWFGGPSDTSSFEDRLRGFLADSSTLKSTLKKCHGDLHADNIMVGYYEEKLIPKFIDFYKTTPNTHCIMDLVTLESDLIISCLEGTAINSFLELIEFPKDGKEMQNVNIAKNGIGSLQTEKIYRVVTFLRENATRMHKVSEKEYLISILLRTLDILSFGDLRPDQNMRAKTYVTYLVDRLKTL